MAEPSVENPNFPIHLVVDHNRIPMNRTIGLLTIIILTLSIFTSAYAQTDHIGLWEGTDKGEVGYVMMEANGFAYFIIKGDTLGGASFTVEGYEAAMKYEVNYAEEVHSVDFVLYLVEAEAEVGRLPGIFKFEKDGSMILSVNFKGPERPQEFVDDTITLQKVGTGSKDG